MHFTNNSNTKASKKWASPSYVPKRIISLVPSQTELLFALGLEEEVVGITKFCVHPSDWFRKKTRIGGTKNVNYDLVKRLSPDLIIANKEENVKEQVEALQNIAPVWTSDISNLYEAFDMIHEIGRLTDRQVRATEIVSQIKDGFEDLYQKLSSYEALSAIYLIWKHPYMSVGNDTFIHDMMQHCKLNNLLSDDLRYPQLSVEKIQSLCPDIILLSSEPFPFKEKHVTELQELLPTCKIILVDGEMFSWYGSRMMHAPAYFCGLWDTINSSSTSLKS